jgi:glyoxylase-like metal-dependent hydrolase (beta-lactamase superfamily II)
MYLLLGTNKAILFDTGAAQDDESPLPRVDLPIEQTVRTILAQRSAERQLAPLALTVAHTHSHGDHVAWDDQFRDDPRTTVIGYDVNAIKSAFGFTAWPESRSILDLGGRKLDVFPIPGHEEHHIAVYDRNTEILLTGDMLYPGVLTVDHWEHYRASAAALYRFVTENPVSFVLGAHVEMKKTPRLYYEPRTSFQPQEHVLPLGVRQVRDLHLACEALAANPRIDIHDDFVIWPL